MKCLVDTVALGQSPPLGTSLFPCQYHSTIASYSFICHLRCIMFFSRHFSFPISIVPPTLHTHSFIYHPRRIMFFSQHFSFPCQYHSTNAPYSFVHLPPTLKLFFSQNLSFPVSIIPPMLLNHLHLHVAFTRRTK